MIAKSVSFLWTKKLQERGIWGIALLLIASLNSCNVSNPSLVSSIIPPAVKTQTPFLELVITPIPSIITTPSIAPCTQPSTWQVQFRRSGGISGRSLLLELSDDGKFNITDEKTNLTQKGALSPQESIDFNEKLLSACPYFDSGKSNLKHQKASCPDCFIAVLDARLDQEIFSFSRTEGEPLPSEVQELFHFLNQLLDGYSL